MRSATEPAAVIDAERGRGGAAVFAPVTLLTVTLEQAPDGTEEVHVHAGGQGVWQARMATLLGARTILCTLLGGETGAVLRTLLEEEGIEQQTIEAAASNATWIHDRRGGAREPLWEGAPATPGRHELDELYSATLGAALACGLCVLAGTHERSDALDAGTYERLAGDLRAAGALVVADVTGPQLEAVLRGGPELVKVSEEDMLRDGHLVGEGRDAIRSLVERLHERGANRVVVSRADAGAIASDGREMHEIRPPRLEVADSRGAGDSMTAGLAVGLSRGLSWEETLRLAAAASAVNVTRHGSGSGRSDAIAEPARRVSIAELTP